MGLIIGCGFADLVAIATLVFLILEYRHDNKKTHKK